MDDNSKCGLALLYTSTRDLTIARLRSADWNVVYRTCFLECLFSRRSADLHFHGSLSATISIGGYRFVYKPRPLAADVAFLSVLHAAQVEAGQPQIAQLQTFDRGQYGWQTYVAPAAASSPQSVEAFFRNAGFALGVCWLCSGTDCHSSNAIAANDELYIVDCETFFSARTKELGPPLPEGNAFQFFEQEMLTIGFLPIRRADTGDLTMNNNALLCNGEFYKTPGKLRVWQNINSDYISTRTIDSFANDGSSACRLEHAIQDPRRYLSEITSGLSECLYIFKTSRGGLRAELIRASRGVYRSRLIIRDTFVYDTLISYIFDGASASDFCDRTAAVDSILKRTLPNGSFPELRAYEVEQLGAGYVPRFWIDNSSGDVFGDDGVRYFRSNSVMTAE